MPNQQGWVDCGPAARPPGEAGAVAVMGHGSRIAVVRAYSDAEVGAIVRRGREFPRPLTLAEERLAERNREIAAGDLQAIEVWAKAGFFVSYQDAVRESRSPRTPGSNYASSEQTKENA